MGIIDTLKGDFVTIDLGSSLSKNNKLLKRFFSAITAIEIDALDTGDTTASLFYKSIKLKTGVAGESGVHTFYRRKRFECSSLLGVLPDIPQKYGVVEEFRIVNEIRLECRTLPEMLKEHEIEKISYLKTDLEGLDFTIIKSLNAYLSNTLVIQSELRFDPFYESEPHSFEVQKYMHDHGFETIAMLPTFWKYGTPGRNLHRDGRLVWGDFIFFRKLRPDDAELDKNVLKQILIAKSLKLDNHAEYLYEKYKHIFPGEIRDELYYELKPKNNITTLLNRFFSFVSSFDKTQLVRKGTKYLYKRASVIRDTCYTPPPN